MSVEFNRPEVMQMFESKRKRFLTKTGLMGANIAAVNSRVDTGASQNAKQYRLFPEGDMSKVRIEAPLEYDIYLERRYGIMAKTTDELIPYMARFEEEEFG